MPSSENNFFYANVVVKIVFPESQTFPNIGNIRDMPD